MAAASSNEFQLIVPKTHESVQVKLGSDFTVLCHLSPEISAVDMEIRWFKETDCVCIYKNRHMIEGRGYEGRVNLFTNELQERGDVSLQLKNFKRTDAGLYLCQVISESTTVEITVQVKEAREDPDVHSMSQPLTFQSKYVQLTLHEINKTWGKRQRMKMEESALMTELVVNNVEEFHQKLFQAFRDQSKKLKQTELKLKETVIDLGKTIESKNHELHVKHRELEINKKTQMEMREQLKEMQTKLTNTTKQLTETSVKNKESQMQQLEKQLLQKTKDTELENLKKLMNEKERLLDDTVKELEASKHQLETLRKRIRNLEGLKVFYTFAGKTNKMSHRNFTETLLNHIQNLKETSTVNESDIVLVFCPIVSGAEMDIEAALKTFTDSTASKLNVLVVLHHTFDPEKTVPDSSRCVNKTDILTVDCLYYEDTGLLECQKNQDAMDKVVNWLIEQGEKRGVNVSLHQSRSKSLFL
ncbi:uncharacterized protein [Misgurnus anguillicaudatus]|uniref:uncharacterized protein n=1 Tax=Misgurnus anguillicaudatus TaxID=75329 RepID=UPI003CCF0D5D